MIKKGFIILLLAFLVLSMSGVVSAEVTSQTVTSPMTSTTTTVSYGASQHYTVLLPQGITFTSNQPLNFTITASNVVLSKDHQLNVSVISTHNWTMMEHDTNDALIQNGGEILYSMTFKLNNEGGTVTTAQTTTQNKEYTVLTAPTGTGVGEDAVETTLTFEMLDTPHTGEFKDTLTFTLAVEIDPTAVEGAAE